MEYVRKEKKTNSRIHPLEWMLATVRVRLKNHQLGSDPGLHDYFT
jgi:hypothetical protein